jgi:hypothetical protein
VGAGWGAVGGQRSGEGYSLIYSQVLLSSDADQEVRLGERVRVGCVHRYVREPVTRNNDPSTPAAARST